MRLVYVYCVLIALLMYHYVIIMALSCDDGVFILWLIC